jgi:hypothetical protein
MHVYIEEWRIQDLGKGMPHQKHGVPIDNDYLLKNRKKYDNKV